MNESHGSEHLEDYEETELVILPDIFKGTLPLLRIEYSDGCIADPDSIYGFHINISPEEYGPFPVGTANFELDMRKYKWYDISAVFINSISCRVIGYDPIIVADDTNKFFTQDANPVRIFVNFNLPVVEIPKITNAIGDTNLSRISNQPKEEDATCVGQEVDDGPTGNNEG